MEGQAVIHLVQPVRQQHAFTFATLDIWRAEDVSFRLSEWKVINTGRTHDKLLQCAQWGDFFFFEEAFPFFLCLLFILTYNIHSDSYLETIKVVEIYSENEGAKRQLISKGFVVDLNSQKNEQFDLQYYDTSG